MKEVRAESFILVDANGNETARLSNAPGGPILALHVKGADTDVVLGGYGDVAGLGIIVKGKSVITLESGDRKTSSLSVASPNGKSRVMSGIDDGDVPFLVLVGSDGKSHLFVKPGTSNSFDFTDSEGKSLISSHSDGGF
jgi:hypothetical protein